LAPRCYGMHRMRLLFDKGALFYGEYNLALFFFLVFHKYDLVVSNDLDTLPACYLANLASHPFAKRAARGSAVQKRVSHLHDCHEYFRGVPELVGRKTVTGIWKWIEGRIFPKLPAVVAVNSSVANLYSSEFGNKIEVIRNVPFRKSSAIALERSSLDILPGQKIILYQGAVNVDRGLEEAILSMKHIESDAILVIAGTGDIFDKLVELTDTNGLKEKVRFLGQVPFGDLHAVTMTADLGLSIEKDVSINYHFCLPNKFLDYIQAMVPVLVSPFPEMKAIVDRYLIGDYLESHDPAALAEKIDSMLNDPEKLAFYKKNMEKAARELCWENEESRLLAMIS
ncbi:MAG: glycosyltransferase family 4 protein, partial [Bacteroidota bacterium]